MMRGQGQKQRVHEHVLFKIVDDRLAVIKVHHREEEVPIPPFVSSFFGYLHIDSITVPIDDAEPGEFALFGGDMGNVDDLFKDAHLDAGDKEDHRRMANVENRGKAGEHHHRPDGSRPPIAPLFTGGQVDKQRAERGGRGRGGRCWFRR